MFNNFRQYTPQPQYNYLPTTPNFINNNYINTEISSTFDQNKYIADNMIQNRLDKLNYERQLLTKIRNPYLPPTNPFCQSNNLINAGNQIICPHSHNHLAGFFYPMYIPLETPKMCSPVIQPKLNYGGPVREKQHCCCHKKGNVGELLLLLTSIGNLPPATETPKKVETPKKKEETPKKEKKKIKKKREGEEIIKKADIPENKKKRPMPRRGLGRDWWRLARDFVNLYLFWGTAYKYSIYYRKIRENGIEDRTRAIVQEISILKDWLIAIEEPFWNEFKIFEDLNVSFKNVDAQNKIKKQSQKIIAIIKKFFENLISRSSKLSEIPTKVQKILYEFIKERAYFPKKYLSTFQTNRIDFEFYGGSRNVSVPQAGMIISYLIICGICVQQILLHMKDVFIEFTKFPYIDISGKYIGSIMHYLTRDTFMYDPGLVKDIMALFNYYRNYHMYNEQIEKQQDVFSGNLMLQDTENEDEYSEYLVPEDEISEFWNLNPKFVETYKNFIYAWSTKIAKAIKMKFYKEDPNPLPRNRLEKPLSRMKVKSIVEEDEKQNKRRRRKKDVDSDD